MSGAMVAPFLLLVFATWAVSLGGIASLQVDCKAFTPTALGVVNGFSGNLGCTEIYRYYWFIVAFEFAVILIGSIALVSGVFLRSRIAVVGLFCIATLLYIQMTDSFLSAQNLGIYENTHSGHMRWRVILAGSISTAAANCFFIISAGTLAEVGALNGADKNPV